MPPDVSILTVTFGDHLAATRVGTGLEAVQRAGGDPLMEAPGSPRQPTPA
ncbi:MAG: hypothetical protein LC733_07700 [Actinobacteria bacterium]|nr:hypothetical protein [Actinomycetota bacterium]